MGDLEQALEHTKDAVLWKKLCAVHQAMEDHPAEAETIFRFCTFRGDKPATSLSKTFGEHGIELNYQAITRHRNRRCGCDRRMPERYDA